MSQAAASAPKVDLQKITELVEKRFVFMDRIASLEVEKQEVTDALTAEMLAAGLNESPFYEDRAFRLQEKLECDYSKDAYKYAKNNGIIELFTPPPKITRAKVFAASKKAKITLAQFNRLQKCAGKEEKVYTLVQFKVSPQE
jgi:hypothetical protein